MTDSIHYYGNRAALGRFLKRIADKSILLSDVFAGWRESIILPKKLGQLAVQQALDDIDILEKIFVSLMKMPAETKYKFPYDKKEREKEIVGNIADVFQINERTAQCKIIAEYHENEDTGQRFPYGIEVAITPRADLDSSSAGQVTFIGCVNDTPAIDGGERYFQDTAYSYSYKWTDRKGSHTKNSAREVLSESGFNTDKALSRRKVPSVVYINLRTNVPDWIGSAGKTSLPQAPYAAKIAEALSTMSCKIPSYHGQGHANLHIPSGVREKTATDYLDDFLEERRKDVEADPSVKQLDGITQRTAIYRIRPKMEKEGFEPRKNWGTTCKSLANSISQRCQELWTDENITREDLGIYAKARGMMYYQGQTFPIDYESIDELASKARINIVIEKEGVPRVLKPYADKYGIALINTQGRFTKYVIKFIEKTLDNGSIVVTIVDDDVTGDDIANSTKAVKIGIFRKETLEWLKENVYPDLEMEDILEGYYPYSPYEREFRAEIDAIIAVKQIGAAGLWKYILHMLQSKEIAPEGGYDLTDLVTFPANEVLYRPGISDFFSQLNSYTDEITEQEKEDIQQDLAAVTELPEIGPKNDEIDQRLSRRVAEDEGIRHVEVVLTELREYLQERRRRERRNNAN